MAPIAPKEPPPELTGPAYGLPVPVTRQERFVREGFWRKLRKAAGRIPFAEDAVAVYYCALDPKTPPRVRAVLVGAVAYFMVPTDLVPDFIAGLGFGDDAAVLATVMGLMSGHIKDRHRKRARQALLQPEPGPDDA